METNKTAFIEAIQNGEAERVKTLLASDAELVSCIDEPWFDFDAPAVVFASAIRNRALIDVLLDAGADIDIKSKWWAGGTSALHHVTGSMLNYNRKLAQHLIRRGATIDAHAAAGLDMPDRLEALIRENPDVVNAPGCDGMSPLHFSATPRIAALLLAQGADINARDRDHNGTPAQWTMSNRPDVCRYLLEQGAEGDIVLYCAIGNVERAKAALKENPELLDLRIKSELTDGYAVAPLNWPYKHCKRVGEVPGGHVYAYAVGPNTPLLEVALRFKQPRIIDMLIASGYQIKLREWYSLVGQGPRRFDQLVKLFLSNGWDINVRQKHRRGMWAPLHWLVQRGLTSGIACLLENGADPNVVDDKGRTPMHIIAQKGVGKNQVQLLIENGGNRNARDADGQTPLDYAEKAKNKSVAKFLSNLSATEKK